MMFRLTGIIQVSQEQIMCCLSFFFVVVVVVVSEDSKQFGLCGKWRIICFCTNEYNPYIRYE